MGHEGHQLQPGMEGHVQGACTCTHMYTEMSAHMHKYSHTCKHVHTHTPTQVQEAAPAMSVRWVVQATSPR